LFEKENSCVFIKTKPGDKEIIELGDTLLRPKSKQNYSEKDNDIIKCTTINDKFETKVYYKKPMLIKTKPGDKEIIELGDTLLRPKSKQNYSEKDIDKIAELGYN
jgi:hypothetical protein